MEPHNSMCRDVPPLLSSFVDAFVDFAVSGIFLPNPNPNPDTKPPPTVLPSSSRLVAVGDLHGDLAKSIDALSLAGIVDTSTLRWSGGSSVAVQVGDIVDRGGDELRLLYLLHRLKSEAALAGGALVTILGNHEVMNADLNFRYATPEGLAEFERWAQWYRAGIVLKSRCPGLEKPRDPFRGIPREFHGVKRVHWEGIRARIAALRPDGPITSRFLAANQTVVVVGDTVFVHGGLLEDHVNYGLERINEEVREWLQGRTGRHPPRYLRGRDSMVWLRQFSDREGCDCERLSDVLAVIPGAARMVMGHTIQRNGINSRCDLRAIRIDVGLSKGCTDGLPEVLEIRGGHDVRVLTTRPVQGLEIEEKKGLALLLKDVERAKKMEMKA